jgi:hypothetical protein
LEIKGAWELSIAAAASSCHRCRAYVEPIEVAGDVEARFETMLMGRFMFPGSEMAA